jgi:hypothetical protein
LRRLAFAILTVGVCVAAASAALAQDASPAPSLPSSPLPSPAVTANPNGWMPIRFVGGEPDMMTVTSDCGIPGVDTFHLTFVGPVTGQLDVTFTDYDAANFLYTGREVGRLTPEGEGIGVYDVDDDVTLSFDAYVGMWFLQGHWMKVPMENCAPPASPGA